MEHHLILDVHLLHESCSFSLYFLLSHPAAESSGRHFRPLDCVLRATRECRDSKVKVSGFFRRVGGFHKPATVSACFLDSCPVYYPVVSHYHTETKPDGLGEEEWGVLGCDL